MADCEPDEALARRMRTGDPAAIRVLVSRHHAVAALLAAAAAGPAGPGDAVLTAWRALRTDDLQTRFRAALLARIIDVLVDTNMLDQAPTEPLPALGPFLPEQDPWAGWWADDGPAPWPDGAELTPATVLRCLRRLPLGARVLLVLRDAAQLSPDTVADIVGQSPEWQAVTVHRARDTFVATLDEELRR